MFIQSPPICLAGESILSVADALAPRAGHKGSKRGRLSGVSPCRSRGPASNQQHSSEAASHEGKASTRPSIPATPCQRPDDLAASLQLCAAELNAPLTDFMLQHLPINFLAALRGTCLAFQRLVDSASADLMLAALKTANLLPPGIADHLDSSHCWHSVVQRHAAVMRRLSSGSCSGVSQLQLHAQPCVQKLAWSPDWPATSLAVHVEPCLGGPEAQTFLVGLNTVHPTAAFPIREYLYWHEWISETCIRPAAL